MKTLENKLKNIKKTIYFKHLFFFYKYILVCLA